MTTQASDFPIPADIQGFWMWDKMHGPRPFTPLSDDIFCGGLGQGFTKAMDEFASPIAIVYRCINYYGYINAPLVDLKGETFDERLGRYREALGRMVPQIGTLWRDEWLPQVLPQLERCRSMDYGSLSDSQLITTFDDLFRDFVSRYVIHGYINFVLVAATWFADFYNENFAPEDATEPYEALQGVDTKSVDAGRGLWRLSRIVKASPLLSKAFQEVDTRELPAHLERSDEGRAFLAGLRAFLDEFGWRSDVFELAEPSWRENPSIPLNALQGYIYLDASGDPDIKLREAQARRDALLARARERLKDDPEKLARFESLYEAARHTTTVTEDHNFWIDQIGNTMMRLPILEIGRRLVAKGAIAERDDVFMLHIPEIKEAMAGKDFKALITTRRAEMARFAKVVPPPVIGEPPPPSGDPFEEAIIVRMFGVPPEPSRDPSIITGIPASRGTVQGRAKVVRDLSEASKIEPGDILVCEMTMPPWTPLFATVSAVVADTGGILSHCALVAREYHLPCVVGTAMGTSVIKDGMLLTVDGTKGVVRIDQA